MKTPFVTHALLLSMIALVLAGCLSSIPERQGTKAYLEKDYATAKMKYDEALMDGNADAAYHLAVMYTKGQGVQQDYAKAAGLLEQAVAMEQHDAQLMLGLFNIYGDGVPKNPAKGAQLIKASAVSGNDTAMYYLGNLYAAGLGVQRDLALALHWMEQAKQAGFPVKDELLTPKGLAARYR